MSIPSWHIQEGQTGQKKSTYNLLMCHFFLHVIFLNTNTENIWCLLLSTGTGIALSGVMTNSETSGKCSHLNSRIHLCRWCSLTGLVGVSRLSPVYFFQCSCEIQRRKGLEEEWEVRRKWVRTTVTQASVTLKPTERSSAYLLFSWHLFLFKAGGGNRVLQWKLPPHCSPAHAIPTNTQAIASRCTHITRRRAHNLPQRRVTRVIISRQISASASRAAIQRAAAWFMGHEPVCACRAFAYLVVSSCRGARAVSSAPQGPCICLDRVPASRHSAHPSAS